MKTKVIIFDLDDTLYDTSHRLDDNTPNYLEMYLLPGVRDTLLAIDVPKILLTFGREDIQKKKIDVLDIKDLFDEIIIVPSVDSKVEAMKDIASRYVDGASDLNESVMIVGDRYDSEIKSGNQLGFVTVKLPGFKYKDVDPKDNEKPTYMINNFRQLLDILEV